VVIRHPLTAGAWVDHRPGWVHGSDEVLSGLLDEVDWRAERRVMYDGVVDVPRLLRWYDGDERLPHPVLTRARQTLSAHYAPELGEPFVTAGMCLYRDGRDSVAWHGDTKGDRPLWIPWWPSSRSAPHVRCCCVRAVGARACGSHSGTATSS